MRVGILTYHNANNYGAVLQAYALQRAIKKMNYDCKIIDYSREKYKDVFIWQKKKFLNMVKGIKDKQPYTNCEFINLMLSEFSFQHNNGRLFADFRNQYMELSQPVVKKNIGLLNEQYDFFIAGSDQIWNPGRINIELTYMLDFVTDPNKKGSYAASFGVTTIPYKYIDIYRKIFKDYKYLLVREQAGAQIIKQLTGRTAKVVLDPTFLLDQNDWNKIVPNMPQDHKYILVYQLGKYSDTLMGFAHDLSKKTGYPVRIIHAPKKMHIADECCKHLGPAQWVQQIRDAEYIVTNSFHGVAFSINFNKPFFVEISQERLRASMGSRIHEILGKFQLEDRLIINGKNDNWNIPIHYDNVNQILQKERNESLSCLKNMLSEKE